MRSTAFSIFLLTAVLCGCSSGVSSDDWLKIKRGMDKDTVKLIIGDPIDEFESEDKSKLYWDYMVNGEKWIVLFNGFGGLSDSYAVVSTFKEKSPEELKKHHEQLMKKYNIELLDEDHEIPDKDGELLDEDQETPDAPPEQKPRRPFD